ncbi:MAG: hypothetical protein JSU92_03115 [Deltaproteobacteria bacterium]|nr:MAG: hypothetical protein JSU92_03115 [Deltaproteobacteria bacterium]
MMKHIFRLFSFFALIVLVFFGPLSRVAAQTDEGAAEEKKTIELLSNNRQLTMEDGEDRQFLSITKHSPVVIRVQGPSTLKVYFRKVVYPQRPETLEPFELSVILNGKEKQYQIEPAKFVAYPGGKTYQTSLENILRFSIPEGEHRCEFKLPPAVIGGGGIAFEYEEVPEEKVAKKGEEKVKPVGPVKAKREEIGISLGPQVGYIFSLGDVSSFYPELDIRYRLPVLDNNTYVSFVGGYYTSSEEESWNKPDIGSYNTKWELSVIPLTLNALYYLPLKLNKLKVIPYAGFGFGYYLVKFEYGVTNSEGDISPPKELDGSNLGMQMFGGASMKLGPGKTVLELKYSTVKITADESESTGDVGGIAFTAGYLYSF